jgi:hypothetical protein
LLLSLALCVLTGGLKLEDLRKVYFEMKERVFKPQSRMLTTACDTEALEDILKKSLGTERKMNDVKKPKYVVFPVVEYSTTGQGGEKQGGRGAQAPPLL